MLWEGTTGVTRRRNPQSYAQHETCASRHPWSHHNDLPARKLLFDTLNIGLISLSLLHSRRAASTDSRWDGPDKESAVGYTVFVSGPVRERNHLLVILVGDGVA